MTTEWELLEHYLAHYLGIRQNSHNAVINKKNNWKSYWLNIGTLSLIIIPSSHAKKLYGSSGNPEYTSIQHR